MPDSAHRCGTVRGGVIFDSTIELFNLDNQAFIPIRPEHFGWPEEQQRRRLSERIVAWRPRNPPLLLHVYLSPKLFSRVASLCPGIYLDSPFSDLDTIKAAIKRTGADPSVALGIYLMAKQYVSNVEEWNKISPIELIKKAHADYPELYLSCGLYDKFGNYEGTEALADIAHSKGVKTQWHPLYGGHCAIDISSLADFLFIN